MSEANCGNCRFWKRGYDSSGGCRRHAPRPFTPGRANWAGTEETEWCGEHQPIEAIEHSEPVKEGSETNFESHEAMFDSVGNLLSEAIKEYQS